MLSLEWIGALARYNTWMNDKLYALVASWTDEERNRDRGAFFQSVHGTFNHILLADRIWLARLNGAPLEQGDIGPDGIRSLDQILFSDFQELRLQRARTDRELSLWISDLTDKHLASQVTFVRRGAHEQVPLWWVVAHIFNHQTHHRGQITTLLTQQGCDPGTTDLFAMLREEAGTR